MKKVLAILLSVTLISITLKQAPIIAVGKQTAVPSPNASKVITDIRNWNHPVKKVLADNKIGIKKVQLLKNNTYPVFYVAFSTPVDYGNKDFFSKIEWQIAQANSFWDYKMIDESKKITIEVFCDRQQKLVMYVLINGVKNYFIKLRQEEAIKNYHYIKPVSIKNINSIIDKIVQSKWSGNFESILGKPDSSFNGYSIYFNKGIRIDSRQKIFNIVFNNKFNEKVVNDITIKSTRSDIIKALGAPQFSSSSDNVFGYKTEKFYIFFTGKDKLNQISVYRRDTGYDKTTLKKIIEGFSVNSVYQKFDALRNKWVFYDMCYDERGGFGLEYYSMGIRLSNDSDFAGDLPDLTIYGNYEGDITDEISLPGKTGELASFNKALILLELDKDYVFEYEKSRIKNEKMLEGSRTKGGVLSPDGTKRAMENNGGTFEHAGIFILSVTKGRPDVEFRTPHFPDKLQWLNNRYLLYEVTMYGIYVYDTEKSEVIEVNEKSNPDDLAECQIISVKSGQITYKDYDSGKVIVKRYSFDKDGCIVFDDVF